MEATTTYRDLAGAVRASEKNLSWLSDNRLTSMIAVLQEWTEPAMLELARDILEKTGVDFAIIRKAPEALAVLLKEHNRRCPITRSEGWNCCCYIENVEDPCPICGRELQR